MSRSIWKGPYISKCLFRNSLLNKKTIKIWDRGSIIPYKLIGKSVLVYGGKEFRKITISRNKVGYKFGEFCYTRKPHKKKEEKKQKKKVKNKN